MGFIGLFALSAAKFFFASNPKGNLSETMSGDVSAFFSVFGMIFTLSFLVALTGAMAPGPLLTYTIIKSAGPGKRGYLMGAWIIAGHALLEMGIIFLLLFGFSFLLKQVAVIRVIGVIGGVILIYFGVSVIRDVVQGKISTSFLDGKGQPEEQDALPKGRGIENPIIGGVLISMANPYWWIWWGTIGFAFMIKFDVSLTRWPNLLAFFLGHEAGDLLWYLIVSVFSFFGIRHLNRRAYYGILLVCGVFMIGFGFYLGISPFYAPLAPG